MKARATRRRGRLWSNGCRFNLLFARCDPAHVLCLIFILWFWVTLQALDLGTLARGKSYVTSWTWGKNWILHGNLAKEGSPNFQILISFVWRGMKTKNQVEFPSFFPGQIMRLHAIEQCMLIVNVFDFQREGWCHWWICANMSAIERNPTSRITHVEYLQCVNRCSNCCL